MEWRAWWLSGLSTMSTMLWVLMNHCHGNMTCRFKKTKESGPELTPLLRRRLVFFFSFQGSHNILLTESPRDLASCYGSFFSWIFVANYVQCLLLQDRLFLFGNFFFPFPGGNFWRANDNNLALCPNRQHHSFLLWLLIKFKGWPRIMNLK